MKRLTKLSSGDKTNCCSCITYKRNSKEIILEALGYTRFLEVTNTGH